MMSLDSSMSLNIPSSLLVKAAPHSAGSENHQSVTSSHASHQHMTHCITNSNTVHCLHMYHSSLMFNYSNISQRLDISSLIKRLIINDSFLIQQTTHIFTMLELRQHRFLCVNRSALADQQTLGQVLLIKSFKHIFSWRKQNRDQDPSLDSNKLHRG